MKKIPLLALISLISFSAISQSQEKRPRNLTAFDYKRIHFGFSVGFNLMDLGLVRNYEAEDFIYADVSHPLPGFQVGIISDLRLSANWNLRFMPGISFGSREINYYEYDPVTGPGGAVQLAGADNPVALGPGFLDFPLHFKYRSDRVDNYRPYLVGGLNFRYDMAAKKENDADSKQYLRLKPADLYVEIGFGIDTYLKYFKFAPEIKLAVGLANIMVEQGRSPYPQFVNSIHRATSYIVMLNFHFE